MKEIDFELLRKYGWRGNFEMSKELFNRMKINANLIKVIQKTKYMVIPTECITKFVLQESGVGRQLFKIEVKPNIKGDMFFFCDTSPKDKE